jgi:hypothetical protein
MFSEVDKNKDLLEKYSKYELVNLAFILLKKEKKDKEKYGKKIILTDLLSEVMTKLSNSEYSQEYIDQVLADEKVKI